MPQALSGMSEAVGRRPQYRWSTSAAQRQRSTQQKKDRERRIDSPLTTLPIQVKLLICCKFAVLHRLPVLCEGYQHFSCVGCLN